MDIADRDVIIPIGGTRAGKGTVILAFQGVKFAPKYVEDFEDQNEESEKQVTLPHECYVMAPVSEEGKIIENELMSHRAQSHTLEPKVLPGCIYEKYNVLNGNYFIDFPGLFDTSGGAIEIAVSLLLKWIIQKARSTRLLLTMSAVTMASNQQALVTITKEKLAKMFTQPGKAMHVGLTRQNVSKEVGSAAKQLKRAKGEGQYGNQANFKDYDHIFCAEQDSDKNLLALSTSLVTKQAPAAQFTKRGCIDHSDVFRLLDKHDPQ